MKDIKNFIWVIILISGIILLISFFTPVSSYIQPGAVSFGWMWGLSYYNYVWFGNGLDFWYIGDPLYVTIPSFLINTLISIVILIGSLVLIIMGNKIRLGRINIKDKENKLVKLGALMIIAPIIYVIITFIFGNIYYDYHGIGSFELWAGANNPGFAFIGPFIGGALALISGIASKSKISREEVDLTHDKTDVITKSASQLMTHHKVTNTKYVWIIALAGGILTLISFFTPALYAYLSPFEKYIWMWGLHYGNIFGNGSNLEFIPTQQPFSYMVPIFLSGIIPAMIILLSSIKIIAITNSIRMGRKELKTAENKIIGWGIVLILAPIIFLIAIDVTMNALLEYLFYDPLFPFISKPNMWNGLQPGFAVIGPIIGALLVIVSGVASKTIKPREEPNIIKDFKKTIPELPTKEKTVHVNYCPDCGKELLYKQSRFCTNCGFEINLVMQT